MSRSYFWEAQTWIPSRRHWKSLAWSWMSCLAALLFLGACASRRSPLDEAFVRAAMTGDNTAAVQALVAGADPLQNGPGENPIVATVVAQGNVELLSHMLDSPQRPWIERQALYFAAVQFNFGVLEALMEKKVDPNLLLDHGRTALYYVAGSPSPAGVELLLRKGANPNLATDVGRTPLINAVSNGYPRTAKALLDGGADPKHVDQSGASAMSWASARADEEILTMLRAAGAVATDKGQSLADLRRDARDLSNGEIEVHTNSLLTDGRHLKIRGLLTNRYGSVVEGVRLRAILFRPDSGRELDRFREDLEMRLEPGQSDALRFDIATMYAASEPRFVVQAIPVKLGGKDFPAPEDW